MAKERKQALFSAAANLDESAEATWLRKRSRNLTQSVVDNIADSIGDGTLSIASKLPTEAQLMKHYSVSRTVIREALSRLQAAGLVETRHGIGTFVLAPAAFSPQRMVPNILVTIQDILAMLDLRMCIETEAAAIAALNHTDEDLAGMRASIEAFDQQVLAGESAVPADLEFHLHIAKATKNRYFEDVYRFMGRGTIPRTRVNTAQFVTTEEPYLVITNREHRAILDAISRRDPEAAREAMRAHLLTSRNRLNLAAEAAGSAS